MTKKHFIAIARMLKANLDNSTSEQEMETVTRIARNLAYEFSVVNGNFRFDIFYAACGLDASGYADWVKVTSDGE